MATRGTYQFVNDATKTTIYVHWDNYLEGAANYFYNMLTNPSKGNLATQFIRAVSHAEITRSHARHGDTDSSNWKSYAEHIKTIVECFPELEEYVVGL